MPQLMPRNFYQPTLRVFLQVLVVLALAATTLASPTRDATRPSRDAHHRFAVESTITRQSDSIEPGDRRSIYSFVEGWWIVLITVFTAGPWAVVAVFDAIDSQYRTRFSVGSRLLLSSVCLFVAYAFGLTFMTILYIFLTTENQDSRQDEFATILVLLVFNLWHVARNVRGWMQFFALNKLRSTFLMMQNNIAYSFPSKTKRPCIQGLGRLRISERLIDNDWRNETVFLNPLYKMFVDGTKSPKYNRADEAWAVAAWRAWWTQDISYMGQPPQDLEAPRHFNCDQRYPLAEGLLRSEPVWPAKVPVINVDTSEEIKTKEQWAESLVQYGTHPGSSWHEGQQDTHCHALPPLVNLANASGIATIVQEKTHRQPNRMSALWYNTARFEEVYNQVRDNIHSQNTYGNILFPSWGSWLRIAQDLGTHLDMPVFLSDLHLVNYAGELASASVIVVHFAEQYAELVDQIHQDGLNARWTFGWSGLLACFSQLWTKERIYIAMLNGLSLLALNTTGSVQDLDENVRSMLYGYAAFEVSDRAVGKRIAHDRKAELLRRYTLDKGKTCRGSGLCATRLACRILQIPGESSHMDGLPSFSTGWASEYLERKPGNQVPEHGRTHEEVENLQGSSNVWRYPHSHT